MTTTTTLLSLMLCASAFGQGVAAPVFACNTKAIRPAERPRYKDLVKRLRIAVREQRELPGGYQYRLDGTALSLEEVAEWVGMERRCCPFLKLELETSGGEIDWTLRLTGPAGVKAFLVAELPMGRK